MESVKQSAHCKIRLQLFAWGSSTIVSATTLLPSGSKRPVTVSTAKGRNNLDFKNICSTTSLHLVWVFIEPLNNSCRPYEHRFLQSFSDDTKANSMVSNFLKQSFHSITSWFDCMICWGMQLTYTTKSWHKITCGFGRLEKCRQRVGKRRPIHHPDICHLSF